MLTARESSRLAELLGASGESIRWGRGFAFLAALWISDLIAAVASPLVSHSELPPHWVWSSMAVGGLVLTVCAVLAFRKIRNELAAAAVAAIAYALLMLPIRMLFFPMLRAPDRVALSLLYVFLFLAGLVLAVRHVRSLWLGLALGAAAGWLADEIIVRLWFFAQRPGIAFVLRDELLTVLSTIVSAAVFAGVFSAGVRLRKEAVPAAATASQKLTPTAQRAPAAANQVQVDGQTLPRFSNVDDFCQAIAARQGGALLMQISDYAEVAQKVLGQSGPGVSPRLLCGGCGVQFPGSFTLRLMAPEIFAGAIVLGASQAGQQFAQSMRCPRCGSRQALYVYDTPPTAGITQSDLDAIRHYWRHLAQQWWQTQSPAEAICDSCNAGVARSEGYLAGSSLYCESCCRQTLGADALERLRQNPDYFGSGELQRARRFVDSR